jgi:DhnA family fructose-bisphosphate aldolase class Ia
MAGPLDGIKVVEFTSVVLGPWACQILGDMGADIIKADPCDDVSEYHRVIEIAQGAPVLVRGGGRVSDYEILTRTKALMDQGARGIVYGRNVIQHDNPAGMTRALMAIVHEVASVDTAMRNL